MIAWIKNGWARAFFCSSVSAKSDADAVSVWETGDVSNGSAKAAIVEMADKTANRSTSDRGFFIKERERDSAMKIDDGEFQVATQIASPWSNLQKQNKADCWMVWGCQAGIKPPT